MIVQWMAPELCEVEVQVTAKLKAIPKIGDVTPTERRNAFESFRRFQDRNKKVEYDQKVDVYAFAVTLWEMHTHQPPWAQLMQGEVFPQVVKGNRPHIAIEKDCSMPTLPLTVFITLTLTLALTQP